MQNLSLIILNKNFCNDYFSESVNWLQAEHDFYSDLQDRVWKSVNWKITSFEFYVDFKLLSKESDILVKIPGWVIKINIIFILNFLNIIS